MSVQCMDLQARGCSAGSDAISLCSQGSYGVFSWGRSLGIAGGKGAGVCPLLPMHKPCAAASSLAQPPPCAAMNCGVVGLGSAAGLCSRRTWQGPS